jgi:hypothetical protein
LLSAKRDAVEVARDILLRAQDELVGEHAVDHCLQAEPLQVNVAAEQDLDFGADGDVLEHLVENALVHARVVHVEQPHQARRRQFRAVVPQMGGAMAIVLRFAASVP